MEIEAARALANGDTGAALLAYTDLGMKLENEGNLLLALKAFRNAAQVRQTFDGRRTDLGAVGTSASFPTVLFPNCQRSRTHISISHGPSSLHRRTPGIYFLPSYEWVLPQ
eukprot:5001153-Pyramimonas_sp.AAC.1